MHYETYYDTSIIYDSLVSRLGDAVEDTSAARSVLKAAIDFVADGDGTADMADVLDTIRLWATGAYPEPLTWTSDAAKWWDAYAGDVRRMYDVGDFVREQPEQAARLIFGDTAAKAAAAVWAYGHIASGLYWELYHLRR